METRVEQRRGTRPGALYGRSGDVHGTVRVITGVLPSGIPFRAETFVPDRTPDEQAAWEARIKAACLAYAEGCVRVNGIDWAREHLEAGGDARG